MSDSKERAGEVPFPELLRAIPSRHRVEIPFLFAEDGTEIGHHIIPVGVHMHRAADLIEQQAERIKELERDAERYRSLIDATEINADNFTWSRNEKAKSATIVAEMNAIFGMTEE